MRTLVAAALTTATLLCASPQSAEAQVLWRPWLRPRVVFVPPRVVLPVVAPPLIAPPVMMPPQVYVQPYPQTYYYPQPAPPPPVYVQPAPPPAPVYDQQPVPPEAAPLPPPPVYVQPAPPPPPVYMQPAPPPPVYVQPAPPPAPAPVYVAPPAPAPVYVAPPPAPAPVIQVAKPAPVPQWRSRFGIGARFVGAISTENQEFADRFTKLGFGGELLYRASRRVVLELSGEYQKRVTQGFDRYDVPVLLGTRLHIGAPDWIVSPYFVGAVGGSYSKLDYLRSQDTAWFVEGQLGGGLEIRLGQHFVLNADLRGDGRYRITDPDSVTVETQKVNGVVLSPMGNQYGLQGRLGAAIYF